jgi:hypothetical protein
MKRRRPVPPTHHLKTAIRKIDKIVWKLHDEQLAAYIAYVLAVSQGEKREIRKLLGAKFTAFGDLSAELERKLTPKERRRAVRLTAYESEMAALHNAAQRLQSRMEVSYMQQRRFKNGTLDEAANKQSKIAKGRSSATLPTRKQAQRLS